MAPRRVPSSAGLPDNWSTEMDEFICYSDAIGDLPVKVIIISLKKRFPSLNMVSRLFYTTMLWSIKIQATSYVADVFLGCRSKVLSDLPSYNAYIFHHNAQIITELMH